MNFSQQSKYFDANRNLARTNALLKFFIGMLTVMVVVLGVVNIYVSVKKQVTLVPYDLSGEFSIGAGEADPGYLAQLAVSDAQLYFNYIPQTVEVQSGRFLQRIHPSIYGKTQAEYADIIARVKKNGLAQSFFPGEIWVDGNTVEVSGRLREDIGTRTVRDRQVKVTLRYRIVAGYAHIVELRYQDDKQ